MSKLNGSALARFYGALADLRCASAHGRQHVARDLRCFCRRWPQPQQSLVSLHHSVGARGRLFHADKRGQEKRVLTGATSPACGSLMMHKSTRENGEDQMIMVDRVDVPAGGAISFAPGGYHLMCMQPSKDMKIGASVPVTLTFADGTKLKQDFPVRGVGGQ